MGHSLSTLQRRSHFMRVPIFIFDLEAMAAAVVASAGTVAT